MYLRILNTHWKFESTLKKEFMPSVGLQTSRVKASRNQMEMSCWKSHLPKDTEIRAEVCWLVQDLVSVLFQKSLHTELLAALHVVRHSSRKEKKMEESMLDSFCCGKRPSKHFCLIVLRSRFCNSHCWFGKFGA